MYQCCQGKRLEVMRHLVRWSIDKPRPDGSMQERIGAALNREELHGFLLRPQFDTDRDPVNRFLMNVTWFPVLFADPAHFVEFP